MFCPCLFFYLLLWNNSKYSFPFPACPAGRYGPDCEYFCDCDNKGVCDPQAGTCECTEGWVGARCQTAQSESCSALPHLPSPLRSLHEKLPCLTDSINIHTNSYRHGNCPWKCKFPWQWDWLSMKKNDCLCGKEIGGTKIKNKNEALVLVSHRISTKHMECSSTLNTCKTYGAWSCNYEHSHLLLLLQAGNRLEHNHSYTILRYVSAKKKQMLQKFWKQIFSGWGVGGGGRFQSFSFESIPMPELRVVTGCHVCDHKPAGSCCRMTGSRSGLQASKGRQAPWANVLVGWKTENVQLFPLKALYSGSAIIIWHNKDRAVI